MKTAPTYILVTANIVVYAYTSAIGGNLLVASPEIHCNVRPFHIVHIPSNMLFLLIFGMKTGELFRGRELYLIYFAAGLAGNLLTLLAGALSSLCLCRSVGSHLRTFRRKHNLLKKDFANSCDQCFGLRLHLRDAQHFSHRKYIAHFGGFVAGLVIGY